MGLFGPGLMCWSTFVRRVHMKLLISAACVLSCRKAVFWFGLTMLNTAMEGFWILTTY